MRIKSLIFGFFHVPRIIYKSSNMSGLSITPFESIDIPILIDFWVYLSRLFYAHYILLKPIYGHYIPLDFREKNYIYSMYNNYSFLLYFYEYSTTTAPFYIFSYSS